MIRPHRAFRELRRCTGTRSYAAAAAAAAAAVTRPKTAMFFPGQGVQKVGMLEPLLADFPRTITPLLEELDSTLPPSPGTPKLSTIITAGPSELLTATENAQPALLAAGIALQRVLHTEFNFPTPENTDFFFGHSLGEFTSLCAAGIITLPDALRLVRRRGELMRDAAAAVSTPEMHGGPGGTGMVALIVQPQYMPHLLRSVRDFLHSETLPNDEILSIANINSAAQIVLSGHMKAIRACIIHIRKWSGYDPRALKLNVSAPFHSQVMAPSVPAVRALLETMPVRWDALGGEREVVSNVTARPYGGVEEMKKLVSRQGVETVQWAESIRYLAAERGVRRWVSVGPGRATHNLVSKELGKGARHCVVAVEGGAKSIEEAVKMMEKFEYE